MFNILCTHIFSFLSNLHVLLGIQACSFLLKISLLIFFIHKFIRSSHRILASLAIMGVIAGSAFEDLSWVASLLFKAECLPFYVKQIFVRFGWIAHIITYQSLSFFVDNFSYRSHRLKWYQYFFITISASIIGLFTFLIITQAPQGSVFEAVLKKYSAQYSLLVLMPFTIMAALYNTWHRHLPRILHYQLHVLIRFFLFPLVLTNIWQVYPFSFFMENLANNLAAVGISTTISLFTIYFCVRRIIGLRFFDIHGHVHEPNPNRFNFVRDFKNVLENLGQISHITEVQLVLQHFFNTAFDVRPQAITLCLRSAHIATTHDARLLPTNNIHDIIIENFIIDADHATPAVDSPLLLLKKQKIFIKDEVEYTHFYQPTDSTKTILHFLEKLNADIFLPLYEDQKIIAAIIIERDARLKPLYTDAERDEMVVFASYLSKIIHLLQNRNLNELIKQRKDITDDLYLKHQEIRQYKESIKSFLRINNHEQSIGILFYKNKKFTFGNAVAQEMLGIDPNTHKGDTVSQRLKDLIAQVMLYKTTTNSMFANLQGKRIVVTAIPQGESDGAVLTVHYPEVSDVIKRLIDHIKDPSDWDYLLYLETTESGKLINSLIPGTSEPLLNFKMELLKAALNKKAVLLDMAHADVLQTVELLHHISLRETLYTLEINHPLPAHHADTAIKLFGINPIFETQHGQPLLERLNKKGTLFIKNIHNLDKESQEVLADLIRYGFYKMYKSDRKVQTDVRLIFSTDKDLEKRVQEGTFSPLLLNELRKTSLTFPSLETLKKEEFEDLMQGFTEQAITNSVTQKLLALSVKDKEKIINQKPESLAALKTKVNNQLEVKSKKQELVKHIEFDAAYNIEDPELLEAARLGKKALKNEPVMRLLWDKFQCQNKIALFLCVNRSSVHRRVKAYNLQK